VEQPHKVVELVEQDQAQEVRVQLTLVVEEDQQVVDPLMMHLEMVDLVLLSLENLIKQVVCGQCKVNFNPNLKEHGLMAQVLYHIV
tara:strand:+ start:585 stop:842 length:258 start_codon:yes stop_codon:yes gene_type:complete